MGDLAATYEYDPYGNTVSASGAYAEMNPFQFSTKCRDDETGMYYHGYRYYLPWLGRWLNWDPIDEEGGTNVYAFVDDNAIVFHDALGLSGHGGPKPCEGIKPTFVTGEETIAELKAMAKAAKAEGKVKKLKKHQGLAQGG